MPDYTPQLVELTAADTSPIIRAGNTGLMQAWINARLELRAHHDVRTSIIIYDEDKIFEAAFRPEDAPKLEINAVRDSIHSQGGRYWSIGIV